MNEINITLHLTQTDLYIIIALRAFGFICAVITLLLMFREFRRKTPFIWTKRLLFVIGVSYFFASLIPLYQTYCFYSHICSFDSQVIPTGIASAANGSIGSLFLLLVYLTKEQQAYDIRKDVENLTKKE